MATFNEVIVLGHLTRDPEVSYLPSKTAVCEFGLATNRKYTTQAGQREEVCFFDCRCFGKRAEIIQKYVKKGHLFLVTGNLVTDQWEDGRTGGKRSKMRLNVKDFTFMDNRDKSRQPSPQQPPQQARQPSPPSQQAPAQTPPQDNNPF